MRCTPAWYARFPCGRKSSSAPGWRSSRAESYTPNRSMTWRCRGHVPDPSLQSGPPQSLQIMRAVGVELDGHVVCDPGDRDVRLSPERLLQRRGGGLAIAHHAGRGGQHAMRPDEVAALAQRLAR